MSIIIIILRYKWYIITSLASIACCLLLYKLLVKPPKPIVVTEVVTETKIEIKEVIKYKNECTATAVVKPDGTVTTTVTSSSEGESHGTSSSSSNTASNTNIASGSGHSQQSSLAHSYNWSLGIAKVLRYDDILNTTDFQLNVGHKLFADIWITTGYTYLEKDSDYIILGLQYQF